MCLFGAGALASKEMRHENMKIYNVPHTNLIETPMHILHCITLLGFSEILTYNPDYKDSFEGNIEDQVYVSRIIKDNFSCRIV